MDPYCTWDNHYQQCIFSIISSSKTSHQSLTCPDLNITSIKKRIYFIFLIKKTQIVKLTVTGQIGLHGLCANKKQVKNVNAGYDHVHNRNLNFMENYVKEILLK